MKSLLFILCLSGILSFSANAEVLKYIPRPVTDTIVLPKIMGLSLSAFIGKPVDSLFSALPDNYTHRRFMPTRGSTSNGVYQSYGVSENNSVAIQIFIDTFQHVSFPPRSKASSWDMNAAKLETISFIRIIRNNVCIYSCGHPFYHD